MPALDKAPEPWLVVIDPQVIFADPKSAWCATGFDSAVEVIDRLVPHFGQRVVVTRWVPGEERPGSWREYFQAWPFADRPASDPYFDLVDRAQNWVRRPPVDVTTFGKLGPELTAVTGAPAHLVLTGVATDCCVISTALAAADAGAWVSVISDGCAGSDQANHDNALAAMALFPPQIEVLTAAEFLARL